MAEITYLAAGRDALASEMRRDASVWAVGEDLGRGGVFGQYAGLAEEFGPERICDAPISEAAILGTAVGAAMMGTRPVVELRFSDFALCAVDELVNQAAKARFMFGGQTRVPIVVREPVGMWRSSAAQHSQTLEAWYTHIPGLVVVVPSTPADVAGLLRAAIRCDDPVVFMEHKNLWGLTGAAPADDRPLPLGTARTVCPGEQLTIVSWSAMVHTCAEAVGRLAAEGLSAELIDLRTLWPWDSEMVCRSVARTGRLLIVHEAVLVSGFGAEIAATVQERMFDRLKAPVRRLGAPRIPVSYAPPLEAAVKIAPEEIGDAARRLVGAKGRG